ncbi:putative thiol-specific monooxygenase [[Candida] railenensis]|uniref:Thiol-specific monooxygenase n=1 Tax=[Candida] railenensis TaxID=45579 RepID=A0A9P0QMR1_9ASCO|nr:putative thiol-specific monooxygenase [[Candida] railenensis]
MTIDSVESIGVVGAGPGGLAAIYEFLHLDKNGTSTVGGEKASNPRFKVIAFEQKGKAGGIWAPSKDADLPVPPQEFFDKDEYANPDAIHPRQTIPAEVDASSTFENPIVIKDTSVISRELEWRRSGVYPSLFTNIPSRFTRFSYIPNDEEYLDESRTIHPFLTQSELVDRFERFISKEELEQYIRFNSRVEQVAKDPKSGKWVITVRETNDETKQEKWYQQEFDAVVIANGHYTVPNFPRIKGLDVFNKKNPEKLIHAKSYRDAGAFKDKKVLVVGGSISTANLVQYIYPVAKQTVISRRGPHLVFPYIDKALESEGITTKPTIQEITEDGEFLFTDGTKDSGFDIVLFTTGYHYHYPFLNDYLQVKDPSNLSRVSGLYYDTFSIEDPTLAITGVAISGINFHSIEASVAAIAGVWSGFGKAPLPSTEVQKEWSRKRVEATADNLFYHYYPHNSIKQDLIDPLYAYAPTGRYNPAEEDWKYVQEIDQGLQKLEKLYYAIKEERLSIEDTLKGK